MVIWKHGPRLTSRRTRRSITAVLLGVVGMLAASLNPVALSSAAAATASPTCQAHSPGGPVFITATCVDPVLNQPYIDADHPSTITDPTTNITVSYRYIHGGFTGTDARFSFYFPAPNQYRGRFFENTYPTLGMGTEDAAPGCPSVGTSACSVAFAISNGAYVVSTNNAGGVPAGGALAPYRANAAAAKYSRIVAEQMVYGTPQHASTRPRGYIYGASGGAYQTVGAMENTSGVWDGAVPQVFGIPNAIPSFMTVELLALRVLADKLPQIAAASEPGGNGNPYLGLDPQQQAVLHEVSRLGFPIRGWWQYATLNGGAFFAVEGLVRALDPTYMNDFWTLPGYEGSDPSVQAVRIQSATSVASLAGTTSLVLANVPTGDLDGADLIVNSGPLAGQSIPIATVSGNTLQLAAANPGITPGTAVTLDNSWLIALQYYQRHQVPTPDEYGWNQYRGPNGEPLEPQRNILTGPIAAASTAGSVANGHFSGKMIMLGSVMDVQAYPWSEDWYRKQAQAALGPSFADSYRLWYMDNADHDPNGPAATNAADAADHIVSYLGEVEQALLDLDAWVSRGIRPSPSTNYSIDTEDQVQLPATAPQRNGVQPVVTLSAESHGGPAQGIDVAAGQPVTFTVDARVPPGTGKLVKLEWDFQGTSSFTTSPLPHIRPVMHLQQTYTFTKPGTYFPTVRVTSQRNGDTTTPYGLIQNLASVRVVVH